jgi:hypothetical protein
VHVRVQPYRHEQAGRFAEQRTAGPPPQIRDRVAALGLVGGAVG